jgi:hypothetical protein
MDDIVTQVDDYGRVVQQNRTTGQHRYLLGNLAGTDKHISFESFNDFIEYLYDLNDSVRWLDNGLVLDLRDDV